MKYCPGCNQLKPKSEFYPSKNRSDGLRAWCKECEKSDARAYNKWRAEHSTDILSWYPDNYKKLCPKCGEYKYYSEFHKSRTHWDGHKSWCKECRKRFEKN